MLLMWENLSSTMRLIYSNIFILLLVTSGYCNILDTLLSRDANNHEKVTSKLQEKTLETIVENDNESKLSTDLIDPKVVMFNNRTGTPIRAKRWCDWGCCGGCCGCGTFATVTWNANGCCGYGWG